MRNKKSIRNKYYILFIFSTIFYIYRNNKNRINNFINKNIEKKSKKVFVVNSNPSHGEVVSSVIYTLSKIPEYDISIFLEKLQFDISDIIKSFYSDNLYEINKLDINLIKNNIPDTIILNTCEDSDILNKHATLLEYMKLNSMIKIICIIHNPSHIYNVKNNMLPFINNKSLYLF